MRAVLLYEKIFLKIYNAKVISLIESRDKDRNTRQIYVQTILLDYPL